MIIPLRDNAGYPRLVFAHDADDRDLAPHGYRGDVVVELADGEAFPVYFYEPNAVREELDARISSGFGQFVAEPGLVVIPEITLAGMKSSVLELIEVGYFSHFKPVCIKAAGVANKSTREQVENGTFKTLESTQIL